MKMYTSHDANLMPLNYIIWLDIEDDTVKFEQYRRAIDAIADASKAWAFDDLDFTFQPVKVVCDGVEVDYMGWAPGMEFRWCAKDTGEELYSICRPDWDH